MRQITLLRISLVIFIGVFLFWVLLSITGWKTEYRLRRRRIGRNLDNEKYKTYTILIYFLTLILLVSFGFFTIVYYIRGAK